LDGLKVGAEFKTTSHRIECFWPASGKYLDNKTWHDVGVWISKCGRAIDKKDRKDLIAELAEQFPVLNEITIRDYAGLADKWSKP
jgi:hypothetical protein